uniref:Uncharacterized protein n=1 Tax=Glossina morsitans morsitans TaxID=37546 RepID=A0A1B0FLD8_GLOMM
MTPANNHKNGKILFLATSIFDPLQTLVDVYRKILRGIICWNSPNLHNRSHTPFTIMLTQPPATDFPHLIYKNWELFSTIRSMKLCSSRKFFFDFFVEYIRSHKKDSRQNI